MKASEKVSSKPRVAVLRDAWLRRVRKELPERRIELVERRLRNLPATPTAANVFFRKELLRLRDASRALEAGTVTPAGLQRENSPFAGMDFVSARIDFRPRACG